jgi:3-phenylpropionate/trans-cinnamate dioxygenase ferredoxin reductase subunit
MASDSTYVIVGASLAGAKAAEGLRSAGFDGRIVLIGDETERPYERPPLSKGYLKGDEPREKIYVHEESWYADNDVELRLGSAAVGVHRDDKTVELENDDLVHYDKLLLATGSSPRRLHVPGSDLDGVLYLRRVGDSETIRESVKDGGRLVVVGGGWIGLETAAAARGYGADVTIVEPQPTPLFGPMGRELGERFAQLHRDNGVEVHTGEGVNGFEGSDGRVVAVVDDDGHRLPADVVVVGVGIRPNTDLAVAARLQVENGIVVDELLQTSDPDVYAAGDVANAYNPWLGERLRVEHWANALNQGKAAGLSMAGQGEPYARIPYFFTDQFDLSMEYHGHVGQDGYDQVLYRGDPSSLEFLAFWLRGGIVRAGMNVNIWDQSDGIKRLVREKIPVDAARLGDANVPLDDVGR